MEQIQQHRKIVIVGAWFPGIGIVIRLKQTGCSSFYLDDTGRNGVLWPDWTFRFRRLATTGFDEGAYVMSARERIAVAA